MSTAIHEWDAAYVLGALSPEDRRIFEEHLEECAECRASVGELAGMPALLARVDPEAVAGERPEAFPPVLPPVFPPVEERPEAFPPRFPPVEARPEAFPPLFPPVFPPVEERPEAASRNGHAGAAVGSPFETRASRAPQGAGGASRAPQGAGSLQSLAHRVRRRRITRRWTLAGASVLAAAAIAAALVLPTTLNAPAPTGTQLTLAQTTPSPLSATVSLTAERWGTQVVMKCAYEGAKGDYATTGSYALYVTDAAGDATRVASWSAWPGAEIRASGTVDLPKSQLRTVQVRDLATDAVLLSSPVR